MTENIIDDLKSLLNQYLNDIPQKRLVDILVFHCTNTCDSCKKLS